MGFFEPSDISIVKNKQIIATLKNQNEFKKILDLHVKNNGKVLIAIGGSTTAISQIDNWPVQIEKLLRDDNYLVINAGHNGYTSYQENILLFQILFPIINPILPDVVISLTGTNDISRSVSSILLRKSYPLADFLRPAIINNAHIGNDIMNQRRMSTISVIKTNLSNSKTLGIFMPSLQAFIKYNPEDIRSPQRLFEILGSKNANNLLRFGNLYISVPQSSGPFAEEDVLKKAKNLNAGIYKSYDDVVKLKNELNLDQAINLINSWTKSRNRLFKNKLKFNLQSSDKNTVINQLLSNHNQTYSTLKSFGIDYYAFLQPISNFIYEKNIKEIPNYNYSLIFWNMRSDIKGHDFTFDGIGIFDEIEERIKEEPFAAFFFKIEFPDKSIINEDPFMTDNIHYKEFGSIYIANEIFNKIYDSLKTNEKKKTSILLDQSISN